MPLKAFKNLVFQDEEVRLLQVNLQQWVQQFAKYPTLAIGTENFRIPRPAFKSSSTIVITLPASEISPAFFFIGDTFYTATSNLTCSMTLNGAGGLDSGSVAANTVYYLYAVVVNGMPLLIASVNDPNGAGPLNFPVWTFLGAFITVSAGALAQFVSNNGRYISQEILDSVTITGTTALTSKTIKSPIGTKFSLGQLIVSGGGAAGQTGLINGFNNANSNQVVVMHVSGIENRDSCEVALDVYNTVYIQTSSSTNTAHWRVHGWVQNLTEWV